MFIFLISSLTYGFLEYGIHRFLHLTKEKRHTTHHIQLKNSNDFISSFYKSFVLLGCILPFINKFMFFLWVQYVFYEFTHDLIHHLDKKFWNRQIIHYHMFHHYYKDWNVNYGVTTPFWDYMFGTMSKYHKYKVNFLIYFSWIPVLNLFNFLCFL